MIKFKWLIALSALFIAGNAAFFSITGLGLLFSGATLAIIIMASSLEIGKLVAATYLHRHWKTTRKLIRFYMLTAVIVLMVITSGGIFGFLSNAYEQTSISRELTDNQIVMLESRKTSLSSDFDRWNNRIQTLTDQRTAQETRYDSLVSNEHWVNARRTFDLITSADEEIKKLSSQIDARRDSISKLDKQILDVKSENIGQEREIGGFRFIARAIDKPIDDIVKWFIIMLIFVFDPLAVALIIAWQSVLLRDKKITVIEQIPEKLNKKSHNFQSDPPPLSDEDEIMFDNPEIPDLDFLEEPVKKIEGKKLKPETLQKKVIDIQPEPKSNDKKLQKEFWKTPGYSWSRNIKDWWNIPEARKYWLKYKT